MEVTRTVRGLKELSEALELMPKKIQGKALGASVAAGAGIVRKAVRANAAATFKDATGATEKSIVAYRKRGSRPDNIAYQVGVTMKKKWPRKKYKTTWKGIFRVRQIKTVKDVMQPAYWWIFSELGTVRQGAKPWFRPAWDSSSRRALAAIKIMLKKAVAIAADQVPKYRGQ